MEVRIRNGEDWRAHSAGYELCCPVLCWRIQGCQFKGAGGHTHAWSQVPVRSLSRLLQVGSNRNRNAFGGQVPAGLAAARHEQSAKLNIPPEACRHSSIHASWLDTFAEFLVQCRLRRVDETHQ